MMTRWIRMQKWPRRITYLSRHSILPPSRSIHEGREKRMMTLRWARWQRRKFSKEGRRFGKNSRKARLAILVAHFQILQTIKRLTESLCHYNNLTHEIIDNY